MEVKIHLAKSMKFRHHTNIHQDHGIPGPVKIVWFPAIVLLVCGPSVHAELVIHQGFETWNAIPPVSSPKMGDCQSIQILGVYGFVYHHKFRSSYIFGCLHHIPWASPWYSNAGKSNYPIIPNYTPLFAILFGQSLHNELVTIPTHQHTYAHGRSTKHVCVDGKPPRISIAMQLASQCLMTPQYSTCSMDILIISWCLMVHCEKSVCSPYILLHILFQHKSQSWLVSKHYVCGSSHPFLSQWNH